MKNTNADRTENFFNAVGKIVATEIVTNIAKHYGTSVSNIYDELYDEDAESLLDYVTINRAAVSLMYKATL